VNWDRDWSKYLFWDHNCFVDRFQKKLRHQTALLSVTERNLSSNTRSFRIFYIFLLINFLFLFFVCKVLLYCILIYYYYYYYHLHHHHHHHHNLLQHLQWYVDPKFKLAFCRIHQNLILTWNSPKYFNCWLSKRGIIVLNTKFSF
jgi:hypothetical protein